MIQSFLALKTQTGNTKKEVLVPEGYKATDSKLVKNWKDMTSLYWLYTLQ